MLIVGERINCTRKRIGEAVERGDAHFIQATAIRQVEAGADVLDVNGGIVGHEEEYLPWLVKVVQQAVDVPLCLDSADPAALKGAIPLCNHRPMINSVTDEPERLEAVLPLVSEHQTKIVALCLAGGPPPAAAAARVEIASSLIERLTGAGVAQEDIYIDPCIIPIGTDTAEGAAVLETLAEMRATHPQVHTIGGMSNVSFGLPLRKLLNEVFLMLAMASGLDSAILDPCNRKLMASIAAAEALLGRDEYCAGYLKAFRAGKLDA